MRRTLRVPVGGLFGAILVFLVSARAAAGQWWPAQPDDPVRVEARLSEAEIRIRLFIDEGWYVYGVEAERIGLPLRAFPGGTDDPLDLSSVGPTEMTTVEGQAIPIHRGRPDFVAQLPPGGVGGEVRVRWAACRGDLCIPRESRVEIPEITRNGT